MGLLDNFGEFVKTPEGQGLLSAVFGGMAGARRGAPWNTAGAAGLAGVMGYNKALENDAQASYRNAQIAKMEQEAKAQQRKQSAIDSFRNTLPPEQQPVFDIAQDDYVKTLPMFQKPQLVEVADQNDPLRTVKKWIRPGESDGSIAGYGSMPEILDPRVQAAKRSIAAAGRSVSNTNVFNNTKDNFKNERDLRNDFAGLPATKAFGEVVSAHDQIMTALDNPSAASDLAAATKFMKILDPGSVVRESELGMAMAATGALDRVQNYGNMLMTGQKLTPSQRADFKALTSKLFSAASDRYNSTVEEYRNISKDYNLDPDRVAKPYANVKKPPAYGDLQSAAMEELKRRGIK